MSDKKTMRIPITDDQKTELLKLLDDVPNKKVIQYDWTSDSGRAFIKQVRKLQIAAGVPLPWIAEAVHISKASLAGAVGYWERASGTRGSSSLSRRRAARQALRRKTADET